MRIMITIIVAAALIIAIGCSNASDPVSPENLAGGAELMGLTTNHALRYVIYDSTVTYFPYYTIVVDTTNTTMQITRGQNNSVALGFDNVAHDLLTVDNLGVLHSGQIRPTATPPDTLFFIPTPVLVPALYTAGTVQSVTSPPYRVGSEDEKLALLFLYYGYHAERKFIGREQVVVPVSSYNAYHFQTQIFLDESSSDTLMSADEYYAAGVGLVKMIMRAAGTKRLIVLLENN